MRVIISAIALIFLIGVALPTPADARPARKVEKWGCTMKAVGLSYDHIFGPYVWYGVGRIRGCDKLRKYILRLAVVEDIPGARNRVHSADRVVMWIGPHHNAVPPAGGGRCTPDGAPPTHPYYFRMQVKRVGKPGVVRVASPNKTNPCPKGTWPSGR